ncbi:MAG: anaerobic ribonucleoside-triphosphate reductase activating protein [Candidatus Saccharibacteria bacterium]
MKLRLSGYSRESTVDGPGIRAVVYAQGCPHQCFYCHNPETWDYEGGYELDVDDLFHQIASTKLLRGVTFSGGEPFVQAEAFAELARKVKEIGLDIISYSGYEFETLLEMAEDNQGINDLLHLTDILIDGPYLNEERDLVIAFRGSRNQRIIDVPASLRENQVVTLDY